MAIGFIRIGSGRSLLVTFVPGVAVSGLVSVWMYVGHIELPSRECFVPIFFAALVVQFLHFAEEFATDFKTFFPRLYGGQPYSDNLFVTFNMASYAVFATCYLPVFYLDARYLLLPVLFFIVYGAVRNAISHTIWSVAGHGYRPGLSRRGLLGVRAPPTRHDTVSGPRHAGTIRRPMGLPVEHRPAVPQRRRRP
jgi:hypothetical protein